MEILQLPSTQSDDLILFLSKQFSQVFSMSNCRIQLGELPVIAFVLLSFI